MEDNGYFDRLVDKVCLEQHLGQRVLRELLRLWDGGDINYEGLTPEALDLISAMNAAKEFYNYRRRQEDGEGI